MEHEQEYCAAGLMAFTVELMTNTSSSLAVTQDSLHHYKATPTSNIDSKCRIKKLKSSS